MNFAPTYRYFLLNTQFCDSVVLASRIRIRTEVKSWIRIRIETNADTQHWQIRFTALHLHSIKGHEMWHIIHKRTDPGF
jgi:hypothetical protein